MLEEALRYLARGFPVFPVCSPIDAERCVPHGTCQHPGKVPLIRWEPYQTRLPAEGEVRSWWRKWTKANIGMATGALPGVVVLDADGADARKEALRRGLPLTPSLWTGKPGGAHFWFAHPGHPVRNFARKLPGIDFRGDGGYVLLPPSRHALGTQYRWVEQTAGHPLAALPEWLEDLLAGRMPPDAPAATAGVTDGPLDLMLILNGIPEGQRNATLWSYASKLRNDDVSQVYAELFVRQAARGCRPPMDDATALDQVRRAYARYAPESTWDIPDEERDPFAEADAEPWVVYEAADLLAKEYPPIVWRIEGWIRDTAMVWAFGAPGTIKTFIATDAALAVATGRDFLGKFTASPGRVLIVQEDTQESDYVQEYLAPMAAAWGLDKEALRGLFYIAPPAGMRLDVRERVLQFEAWLIEYQPAMVVLDAWYLLQGEAEDHGKEQRKMLQVLRALRRKHGGVWWIIDHSRKSGSDGGKDDSAIDRLFGGREKGAAADAVLEVREIKGQAGHVFLSAVKLRGGKPLEGLHVALVDGRLTIQGQRAETPAGAAEVVWEWLCREGGSRTYKQITAGAGLADRTVRGACAELYMAGRVQRFKLPGGEATWLALHPTADKGDVPW